MLRLPSFPIVQLNLPPPHLLQTACAMFIKRALVQRLGVGGEFLPCFLLTVILENSFQ